MSRMLEDIKRDSDYLRAGLATELAADTQAFSSEAAQVLKFHGVYQQGDRDRRSGTQRDYVMMVRASLPGGVLSAEQYLVADELADWAGNGTLRITSRQGLQWHQIRKGSLRSLIWVLNQSLVTTFAACGDVVRNTVACPAPTRDRHTWDLTGWAGHIASRFRPRSTAYYELWVDGSLFASAIEGGDTAQDVEPIYGATYLPRKFKIGIAAPGDNCVDVYTHDVGLVPVEDSDGGLRGFTVLVGGGQGRSHNDPDTYPRLADALTTVAADRVLDVVETVVAIQRDHGNREDRRQARLKYLIDRWGLTQFRATVERRLGSALPDPEPVESMSHRDHYGWQPQGDGTWFFGVALENGRIADRDPQRFRSGLRQVIETYRPEVRFTPQQNVLLCGIAASARGEIDQALHAHGIPPPAALPLVVRDAMACVALPTCGLALTDAERTLPRVIRDLAGVLDDVGLDQEEIGVRMTGCPNGCARPYSTELGLVGRRRDRYDIHLGGARDGTRLNQVFVEAIPASRIAETLRPVLAAYATGRRSGETFGDYTHRIAFAQRGNSGQLMDPGDTAS